MSPAEFKKIFNQHGPLVWSMIRRFTIPDGDAEDLFMEIWEVVWKALPTFTGQARLSTWIGSIARNKSIDYLRKHRLRLLADPDLPGQIEAFGFREWPSPLSSPSRPPPGKKAIREEAKELIKKALEELPSEQRSITKFWMAGYKYRTIAVMLNATRSDPVDTNYIGNQLFLAKSRILDRFKRAGIKSFSDIWE